MPNNIFSFTNRDYEGARKEGMARIPILTDYKWTDLNASDPGIVLLDYVHALVDMLQFYLDHQALESFLVTAKERVNLFKLAKQVSYKVRSSKGSLVDLKAVIDDEPGIFEDGETIIIPAGTVIESKQGYVFRTLETVVLTNSNVPFEIPCQQGEIIHETYTGTGTSTRTDDSEEEGNLPNQSYTLKSPYPDIDTIEIIEDGGLVWENVPYILLEGPDYACYELELNPDSTVTVKFGDGKRGRIPGLNTVLDIYYLSTLGDNGNISEYDIEVQKTYVSSRDVHYVVNFYNDEKSTGGSKGEDDEALRVNALNYTRTNNRAVIRSDYEAIVRTVDGVKDVKVYDRINAPELCLTHEVRVLVIPDNAVSESLALLRRVKKVLDNKSIPPTNVYVLSPEYIPVDITIIASKKSSSLVEDTVEEDIIDIVTSYFEELDIGESYNSYDILPRLYTINGLKSVKSITPTSSEASLISKLILGEISVLFE